MIKKYLIIGCPFLFSSLFLIFRIFQQISDVDSYKFFHLGMANHYSKFGFLKTLPQASQTLWASSFIDPNPWYNFLNGILYRDSGEAGIIQFHRALSYILALTLLLFAYKLSRTYLAIFVLCFTLLSPDFALALSNVGPQNIELLFLSFGFYFLISQKYIWAQLSFVGFGLFTPYTLITLFLLFSTSIQFLLRNKAKPGGSLLIFSMISIPTICHPFFPKNLTQTLVEHYRYFHPRLSELSSELPLRSDDFLHCFWPFLLLCGFSFLKTPKNRLQFRNPDFLLFWTTILLWFFCGIYRPILPYALLSSLFIVLLSLQYQKSWRDKGIVLLGILLGSISISNYYSRAKPSFFSLSSTTNILSSIPRSMAGKLVFNCRWEDGNYIFYLRPDLRTLDLYSPILLKYKNPGLFEKRVNPTVEILSQLEADYVYCDKESVFNSLSTKDSPFELVYPMDKSSWVSPSPYLFARKTLYPKIDSRLSLAH